MPATPPVPGAPLRDPWPADDPWLDEDPGLPPWPADDPEPYDPDRITAWLDAELAKAAPWLADDPVWDDPAPAGPPGPGTPVAVVKAGRWDRARGDGGGFAAGG